MGRKTIDYYREQRDAAIAFLGGACVVCGATGELEIDHINWRTKSLELGRQWAHSDFWAELKKCQLLCKGCHRKKSKIDKRERAEEEQAFLHGTTYSFMKKKCTCSACEKAKRDFYDKKNEKRRISGARDPYKNSAEHGEVRRYFRGCRCSLCRAANAKREHLRRTLARQQR